MAESKGRPANPDAKNGISPPTKDSFSAKVFAECDKIYAKGKESPKPKALIELMLKKYPEAKKATIAAQLARWRQFNGLVTARA